MSKSLKRVCAVLEATGVTTELREMAAETRTAEQAANAIGCALDQIAKSLLFRGAASRSLFLFLTAGGNRVSPAKAAILAGEALERADGAEIRRVTGFAIGGVAPVGHLTPSPVFMDRTLLDFPIIWAAAGTPRHVFSITPQDLARISDAIPGMFCA